MAKYSVLQPLSFVKDGSAIHLTEREVSTSVDIEPAIARPLVEAGSLRAIDEPKSKAREQ